MNEERDGVTGRLGELDREVESAEQAVHALSKTIGELASELRDSAPHLRRVEVAERAAKTLDTLVEQLRPLALERMQESITKHFLRIADERFAGGRIEFGDGGQPVLVRAGEPGRQIGKMSGFERRAFGIAYSLALIEATGRRLPLVIDTPLGNADSR